MPQVSDWTKTINKQNYKILLLKYVDANVETQVIWSERSLILWSTRVQKMTFSMDEIWQRQVRKKLD
jgi:hypothetical protein